LEEQTFTLRRKPYTNLRLRPQTYDLHTTSTLRNITSNPSQKPCNFIYICKYDPFTPNDYFPLLFDYFPLAISPNITRLPSFSYTSLSGIITKNTLHSRFYKGDTGKIENRHFTSRESSFAIRFAILTSYPAKQDLLDLIPLLVSLPLIGSNSIRKTGVFMR
jgi:hypothetical protein